MNRAGLDNQPDLIKVVKIIQEDSMKQHTKEMSKSEVIELATENIIEKMNTYETDLDIAIETELEVAWQLSRHEIRVDELNVDKIHAMCQKDE